MGNSELPNTVTGGSTSIIDINLSSGNFWLTNNLSGFYGTFNVNYTLPGGQLVVGNAAAYTSTINSSVIWNVGVGAVLDFNDLQTDPGTVVLNGVANPPNLSSVNGALRVDDGSLQSGPVILMGNSSIGNGNSPNAGTISGVISDGGNGYGFNKVGAYPITLSGANTFSGNLGIIVGTLTIGGAGDLGDTGAGSGSYAGNIADYATLTFASSTPQTLLGVMSGGGVLNVTAGTLTLTGSANTFSGQVTVNGGNLALNTIGSMASTAILNLTTTTANEVSLNYSGTQNILALTIGGVPMAPGVYGSTTSSAPPANQYAEFQGAGTLTVGEQVYFWDATSPIVAYPGSGGNGGWNVGNVWWAGGALDVAWTANSIAYFGGTAGTVTVGAAEAADELIFATTGYTVSSGSTITLGGSYPNITVSTGTSTINTPIAGTAPTFQGPGTLVLGGANTFTSATINPGSTVQLTSVSAGGTGTITDNGTLAINVAGNTFATPAISGPSSAVLNFIETAADNTTFTANMAGFNGTINCPVTAGTTAKIQWQTSTLPSTATVNIASGGTFANLEHSCAATVIVNGTGNSEIYGALRIDGGAIQSGPVILNSSISSTIGNGNGTASTISGVISDLGRGYGLTKEAVGSTSVIILSGYNTYSGATTVNGATLEIGGSGDLGDNGSGSGFYAASIVINSTSTGNLYYNSSALQTFSGVVSGAGKLVVGAGTLTLTAANTYTGGTTVSNGTLVVNTIADATPSAIGISGTLILGSGQISYTGAAAATTARTVEEIAGKTGTIDLPAGNLTLSTTLKSTASATCTVNKTSAGTLILSGSTDDAYLAMNVNGGTVILNKASSSSPSVHGIGISASVGNGGTLQLSGTGGAEINIVPVTVNNGGVLDMNSQNNSLSSLSLAGAGNSSDNNGGALINSSTTATSTLTSPITLAANSSIGGPGNLTLPDAIGGSGMSLTYSGTGQLTLSGANTFSGGTIVNSGTLDGNVAGSLLGNVTVNGGTLQMDSTTTMPSTATLSLALGTSAVYLTYGGTQNINALFVGGIQQPPGVYGASPNNNPGGIFTGVSSGTLTIASGPPVTISSATINASHQLVISWNSVAGGNYNVFTTTSLNAPESWTKVNSSPIPATGTTTSYTLPGSIVGQPHLFVTVMQ